MTPNRRKVLGMLGGASLGLGVIGLTEYLFQSSTDSHSYGQIVPVNEQDVGIMTYNIANARGIKRGFLDTVPNDELDRNLDRIVDTILESGASIVGFNEIDFDSDRTGGVDQGKELAKRLYQVWGISYLVEAINMDTSIPFQGHFKWGNAIISKYPVKINKNNVFS